jgi:hypothetical protein
MLVNAPCVVDASSRRSSPASKSRAMESVLGIDARGAAERLLLWFLRAGLGSQAHLARRASDSDTWTQRSRRESKPSMMAWPEDPVESVAVVLAIVPTTAAS